MQLPQCVRVSHNLDQVIDTAVYRQQLAVLSFLKKPSAYQAYRPLTKDWTVREGKPTSGEAILKLRNVAEINKTP